MAGLKRFVTYIYSYEEKKKGDNAGFARIEIRGDDCRIEIHLRAAYIGKSACNAYLFREEAGDLVGYPIGEMAMRNGVGDMKASMKAAQIAGAPLDIYQVDGLIVIGGDERIFLSRWKEDVAPEVSRERFRIWKPEQDDQNVIGDAPVSPERNNRPRSDMPLLRGEEKHTRTNMPDPEITKPAQTAQNSPVSQESTQTAEKLRDNLNDTQTAQNSSDSPENTQTAKAAPDSPEMQQGSNRLSKPVLPQEKVTPGDPGETETVSATEIPMRNIFPGYDWPDVWERLTSTHPIFTPFEDKNAVCIQIELKDLRELPKRYWYLGNNSFLLHGFFNYHYLVVGRTGEERWFIGVPGIYQRQERVMAAIFGFPEFITAAVSGGRPGWEEEMQAAELRREVGGDPVNQFGCWYRFIEE